MLIQYNKLRDSGYIVNHDKHSLSIIPQNPTRLDWSAMQEQWDQSNLSPFQIDASVDAFHSELEVQQIMQALKG